MGKGGAGCYRAPQPKRRSEIMDSGGFNWAILNIVGPLLIVIVLAYVMIRNRKSRTPQDIERTEAATRELYREEDAAHRKDDKFGT
jgi:hypothetical protein